MASIRKIEATKIGLPKKPKVAAYARVSTDSDEQLLSLKTQKEHYTSYIKNNPDWEFAGLYFDEGITGTKVDKRDELLRLLKESYVWRCCTRSEKGPKACDAPTVYETELQMATVKAINLVTRCQSSMMDILKENIRRVLEEDGTDEKMEAINELLSQKQKELVKMAQAKKDYTALADEVDSLREQKQAIWVEKAQNEGLKKRIKEMEVFLSSQSKELTEYDETMVRLYIESIRIYDDRFEVTFKAGITVDVQR